MHSSSNIVLTGFMGTGKSTVGRLLAQRLNRSFIDMDVELETHFGKAIHAVFAQEGEAAFRQAERALCQQLAQQQELVISTGGGALVNPANRTTLAETGILFCLTAKVDDILARVGHLQDRPLLAGALDEKRDKVRTLLRQRRTAYAAIPYQIDTSGRTPAQVADAIEDALAAHAEVPNMIRIPVRTPEGSYHICIGEGLLAQTGQLLRNRGLRPGATAIVSNAMIAEHYLAPLEASLRQAGFDPVACLIPEGEQHKTLATIASLYDQFIAAKLDRKSPILALGGGVVGDMTGFAAATYLRGAPFVQIPTSLLSMVDASVGGKTGVDLPQGKNLVGAFKWPEVVIMDTALLQTLPSREFQAGLAEIVKHAIIDNPEMFEQLETDGPGSLQHLVADAVRVKVKVVEEDPFEQGRRATLNLGHTFGHAIEQVSQYTIGHGQAVAIGMVAAMRMATALEACDPALAERVIRLLARLGLPTSVSGYNVDAILVAMGQDKKRVGQTLRFIVAQALGDVVIIDDPGGESVRDALKSVVE